MQELDKGLELSLVGPDAEQALSRAADTIRAWGLTMPPAEPLVLDFGMQDFEQHGLIEYWVANELEAGYCGKFLFLFDGQTCPTHSHTSKHETFYIVKGTLKVTLDGREQVMREGDVLGVAPGKVHSFTGDGPALLLEVSKPCVVSDNRFVDDRPQAMIDAIAAREDAAT